MVSLRFTGVNSNLANSKVISKEEFDQLEMLTEEGIFNFKGDPTRFALFAEAERINSAYQFEECITKQWQEDPELFRIRNSARL